MSQRWHNPNIIKIHSLFYVGPSYLRWLSERPRKPLLSVGDTPLQAYFSGLDIDPEEAGVNISPTFWKGLVTLPETNIFAHENGTPSKIPGFHTINVGGFDKRLC